MMMAHKQTTGDDPMQYYITAQVQGKRKYHSPTASSLYRWRIDTKQAWLYDLPSAQRQVAVMQQDAALHGTDYYGRDHQIVTA